jgi:thioredoxin reductase (NADPH)
VTLLVRADSLEKGMSDYLIRQVRATQNIEVRLGAEVAGGEGSERLEFLTIRMRNTDVVETIPARLLFVLIGASPHTEWLVEKVQRDPKGFVVTGHDVDSSDWRLERRPMNFETSVPGVFAVGDVRLGSMKRVASAVGEGAGAVQSVHQYLEECASVAQDIAREPLASAVNAERGRAGEMREAVRGQT